MNTSRLAQHLVTASLLAVPWIVQAEMLHSGAGSAGSMVGFAKSLSSTLTLRGALVSSPGVGRESIEEGTSYTGHVKSDRGSLFMDWYLATQMRLTGGMTFNRTRVDLRAGGSGGAPLFGEVPYATAHNDRLDSGLRAPHTLPYLGVGFGRSNAYGGNLSLDIGGTFARASLSDHPGGPSLATVSQSALDHELAQLRDGIGRVRFMPQVSLGMQLRF